jgi:hypothetical protein
MSVAARGAAERLALLSSLGVGVLILLATAFSLDGKTNWLEGVEATLLGKGAVIPNPVVAVIPALDAALVLASRTRLAMVAVVLLAFLFALAVVSGLLLLGMLGFPGSEWTETSYLLAEIGLVGLVQWLSLRGAVENARLRGRN